MQPAVFEGLGRRLGIIPIALHHIRARHQDLAVIGDAQPHAVERRPDGVDLDARRKVAADHRPRFGLAVALQ